MTIRPAHGNEWLRAGGMRVASLDELLPAASDLHVTRPRNARLRRGRHQRRLPSEPLWPRYREDDQDLHRRALGISSPLQHGNPFADRRRRHA